MKSCLEKISKQQADCTTFMLPFSCTVSSRETLFEQLFQKHRAVNKAVTPLKQNRIDFNTGQQLLNLIDSEFLLFFLLFESCFRELRHTLAFVSLHYSSLHLEMHSSKLIRIETFLSPKPRPHHLEN